MQQILIQRVFVREQPATSKGAQSALREVLDLGRVRSGDLVICWRASAPVSLGKAPSCAGNSDFDVSLAAGSGFQLSCSEDQEDEEARRHQARGGTRGRIINVSTDAARAFATEIAYGASKAALEAFTRSIACEVGHLGITVNAVAPGPVQTGYITDELEAKVLTSIPLGRIGTVDDIADAIVFFASEQARWITGQVVQIAGGHAL